MDVRAEMDSPVAPAEIFQYVEELDSYPAWLDIVSNVQSAEKVDGDLGDPWLIDLRAQVGPLRRSKRLRMVRSVHNPPHRVRFVRRELDGRNHSKWTLNVDCKPSDEGSVLSVHLHYGGLLWIPMLERVLADEIERSKPRLAALVDSGRTP